MAGITLAQAQTQLDAYLAAETAVLGGQSYKMGLGAGSERWLTRADLEMVQRGIEIWHNRVVNLTRQSAGRGRARTVVVGG
ncbi:DUF6148 family protein [Candidatus Nitrotoga sp. M5]|uniref:DUF6148 family protein n=1 Tax=Candidatus Nitrotoga sp. M5 TaxID=2890409 RepID=UPI001EF67865|nr:DUF6148 family protein [Candidatus Nitrotoga sp. M5]CAH1387031.1 conserved hypothetical protein [Candidatus Nitrotoga sp. M5]